MTLRRIARTGKRVGLTGCLFVTLWILFGPVLRAGEGAAAMGALCATPLAIHVYRRRHARQSRRHSSAMRRRPIPHGLPSLVRRQHSGGF